jgi:hypothetical protein
MIIELKDYKVELKDALTWGDAQKIEAVFLKGAKVGGTGTADVSMGFDASVLLEAKYTALECAVMKVIKGDKTEPFTREWIDSLSIEDGDKLYAEVDKLTKKKEA